VFGKKLFIFDEEGGFGKFEFYYGKPFGSALVIDGGMP
jgi:hypothetical protein